MPNNTRHATLEPGYFLFVIWHCFTFVDVSLLFVLVRVISWIVRAPGQTIHESTRNPAKEDLEK
jgi:hypothetical protein